MARIPTPPLTEQVTRTYTVGLRFQGQDRTERRKNEIRANQILTDLQHEAFDLVEPHWFDVARNVCQDHPDRSGTYLSSHLGKKLHEQSNLGQVSRLQVVQMTQGVLDREDKFRKFLSLLDDHPDEALAWFCLGQSPLLNRLTAQKTKTSIGYARNLLVGGRRTLDTLVPEEHRLTAPYPDLSAGQVTQAVDQFCQKIRTRFQTYQAEHGDLTDPMKVFLERLECLALVPELVGQVLSDMTQLSNHPDDLPPLPDRWGLLKVSSEVLADLLHSSTIIQEQNQVVHTQQHAYLSCLRGILVTALANNPSYGFQATVQRLRETGVLTPEHLVSKPLQKPRKRYHQVFPLALVMGSKYVVGRPGNSAVMTQLAKDDHEFELLLFEPGKRRFGLVARVRFHHTLVRFLKTGATIGLLTLHRGSAPGFKIRCDVVMTGPLKAFLSKTDVQAKMAELPPPPPEPGTEAVDLNRISPYIYQTTVPHPLPSSLVLRMDNYFRTLSTLPHISLIRTLAEQQVFSHPSPENYRLLSKRNHEVRAIHERLARQRKEIHLDVKRSLTALLAHDKVRVLYVEDLSLSTRGTRGALARAIVSVPDDLVMLKLAVAAVDLVDDCRPLLYSLNPRGTSSGPHFDCPSTPAGRLDRSLAFWDEAPCLGCGEVVNVHVNASRHLNQRGLTTDPPPP